MRDRVAGIWKVYDTFWLTESYDYSRFRNMQQPQSRQLKTHGRDSEARHDVLMVSSRVRDSMSLLSTEFVPIGTPPKEKTSQPATTPSESCGERLLSIEIGNFAINEKEELQSKIQ